MAAAAATGRNSANWSGGTVPVNGDDLVFPSGAARLVTTNNFSPNRNFASVTLLASGYVLRGNPIVASNLVASGQAGGVTTVEAALGMVFKPVITVSNAAATLRLRGTNLSLLGTVTVRGNGVTEISSPILLLAGLTKSGTNVLLLHGSVANTYSGTTIVNAGLLRLSKTNVTAIPGNLTIGDGSGGSDADVVQVLRGGQIADTAAVTVNASGWLDCSAIPAEPGGNETIGPLTLNNGADVSGPSGGTLQSAAPLTCTGDSTSEVDGGGYFAVTGTMPAINVTGSGSGVNLNISIPFQVNGFTKTGPGWLQLNASLVSVGDITINAGIFQPIYARSLGFDARPPTP